MPAIPVYSGSPINAAKPSGVTPQTARQDGAPGSQNAPVTATSAGTNQTYPPAQPGARPSLPPPPAPTGAPQSSGSIQPTPTQPVHDVGPPPPQPGAVPTPPRATAGMPPQQPPQTTAMPLPPQMSYPAPTATYAPQGGSSTTTAALPGGPRPTQLYADQGAASYSHPPGYQQNANAAEFSSNQRAAHHASIAENPSILPSSVDGDGEGVWDTAKKWASAAGDSLAAAEGEVWKRLNKD